jgi:hypothetical protein
MVAVSKIDLEIMDNCKNEVNLELRWPGAVSSLRPWFWTDSLTLALNEDMGGVII